MGGQAAARLTLTSDADWLHTPGGITLSGEPESVTVTYDASKLAAPGLYVGTVWARAASDTLAGAVFRLTNTIVVPYRLRHPFHAQQTLAAGAVRRYFFAVPDVAGGLRVAVTAAAGRGALLYLFEPSGHPYRGSNSVETVPGDTATGITVPGEDVLPGVYEADVVAPPGEGVSYTLDAALPAVAVRAVGSGPSAVLENRTPDTCVVRVHGQLIGATGTVHFYAPIPIFAVGCTVGRVRNHSSAFPAARSKNCKYAILNRNGIRSASEASISFREINQNPINQDPLDKPLLA